MIICEVLQIGININKLLKYEKENISWNKANLSTKFKKKNPLNFENKSNNNNNKKISTALHTSSLWSKSKVKKIKFLCVVLFL